MPSYLSPAKVNLFLKIVRKRPDGYHDLASLFQAIDLCDTLHIDLSARDEWTCSDPTLPLDHTNLVVKALQLFRKNTQKNIPVAIHLEKKIPQQAGLGGGSSNAATTLWALNELFGRPASLQDLISWGGHLGSDVPFFLSSGTAYCTGRGGLIRELSPLKNLSLTIVKPQQGLSTPQVYGALKVDQLPKRDPEEALNKFCKGCPEFFNDLETPAFQIMPELAAIKARLLSSGFEQVLMSGSGSSFFCVGQGRVSSDCLSYRTSFTNRPEHSWF